MQAVAPLRRATCNAPIHLSDIDAAVCRAFPIGLQDLVSNDRTRRYAWARFAAYQLARKYTANSLPRLGLHYGGRDHTTILSGLRRFPTLFAEYPGFARRFNEAEFALLAAEGYTARIRRSIEEHGIARPRQPRYINPNAAAGADRRGPSGAAVRAFSSRPGLPGFALGKTYAVGIPVRKGSVRAEERPALDQARRLAALSSTRAASSGRPAATVRAGTAAARSRRAKAG